MLLKILVVHGHSMQPLIIDNEKVLTSSIPYFFSKPKENDIVAFNYKNKIFIKKIKDIKDGKYFLEGENKDDSLDSKKIGWIERKNILGKIIWF